jgi:superfamily II DNA or RNA helicase
VFYIYSSQREPRLPFLSVCLYIFANRQTRELMSNVWDSILSGDVKPPPKITEAQEKINENIRVKAKTQKEQKNERAIKKIDLKRFGISLIFVVCRMGIKVDMQNLCKAQLYEKLVRYFTINVPQLGGYIKKVPTYKKLTNGKIIFPRFGMLDYIDKRFTNTKIKNCIHTGTAPDVPFVWCGSYKSNQSIIADHIMKKYYNKEMVVAGKAGVILNLEAGQGKSYLAAGLIQKLQKKVLVVCHNKTIMYQWIKLLKEGYPQNKISCYYGEKKEWGDVVVGIINSLCMDTMIANGVEVPIKEFYQHFGMIILDEVHEYSSKIRSLIYNRAQSKYMLGLSATPNERLNKMDNVNIWNCGEILNAEHIDGYSVADIPFVGRVTKVAYTGNPEYTKIILNEKMGIISHSSMVSQMCEDPFRIHVIVKLIYELRQKDKNIFVFTDRRNYLTRIKEEMEIFGIASHDLLNVEDEIAVKQLMGGSTADDIAHAQSHSNVILTTYQYLGTGVSIPKMDAIILATPKKTKSRQYVNRIFRLGGNYESVREIIDIVDMSTYMKSQWYKRLKYYKEKNYPINMKYITWVDAQLEMNQMGILGSDESGSDNDEPVELDKTLSDLEALLNKYAIL